MFEELDPKKENSKKAEMREEPNNFSLPGLNNDQMNKFQSSNLSAAARQEAKRLAPPPPALTDFSKRMADLETKGKKRGRRNMFIGTIGGAVLALIVMCFVYYISNDVSKISDRIERDVNAMPDLNNRAKTPKNPAVDTDNDGLSDKDEIEYGTDPNNPDSDGDGFLDGEEN